MTIKSKSQAGFSLHLMLVLILLIVVVGGGALYVNKHHNDNKLSTDGSKLSGKKSDGSSSSDSSSSDKATAGWKTYTQAADSGVTFKYPNSWKLGDIDGADIGNGVKNISVTSPNGSEIDMRSTGAGLGGDCQATEHSVVSYSKPIAGAPGFYVVQWELFDAGDSLGKGLDVMNGSTQGSQVYTELGNHSACITFTFAFSSPGSKGYFFGVKPGSELKSQDVNDARLVLGSLTVR